MEKYNVKFKKKFGQNFLKDINIVKKIVNSANIAGNSMVIEVGPGGAIMTKELAKIAKNVIAYEIDTDLKDELEKKLVNFDNVNVIFKDFLCSNLKDDLKNYNFENLYFVSNVPYYITTPILLKLINSNILFNKIVVMVQKEVGDRFSSKEGSKDYGSISVLLNYYFDVKKEFFVSRKEFVPEPNVDSVVVSFSPKNGKEDVDMDFFQQIIHDSFQFKRKTLRNNLKKYDLNIVSSVLDKYGYDLSVRAECLNYKVFVDLANSLK